MKRREFSSVVGSVVVASAAAHSVAQAQGAAPMPAAGRKFEDGTDYLSLDKRLPADTAGKIEVVEFFWYSCPHCNSFEPKLDAWMKTVPKDVSVRRVPVAFRDNFVPQQRLYYVLEALNKVDALHRKVFYAIHVEKQPLDSQATIGAWLEKNGVPKAKFEELYNSFSVSSKSRKATQLQESFKVDGVPALGVAGRFYTTGALAQTMERALLVTDYLIAEVRKGN